MPQGDHLGRFGVRLDSGHSLTRRSRRNALWKLPELWKNQRRLFPQLLEPSVHSSHNAGGCWTIPKHNFSSTPEEIRLRANQLYEERGRIDGHASDDWLQAEAEVLGAKKRGSKSKQTQRREKS
jgi:Protein of unknown function (DUF2934)